MPDLTCFQVANVPPGKGLGVKSMEALRLEALERGCSMRAAAEDATTVPKRAAGPQKGASLSLQLES